MLCDLHARSKICCAITAYSLKCKNKQKGKHEVAWKMSNEQCLGGRKCKGESGAGESVNRMERRNLERREWIGGIQSWIWQRKEWEMQCWRNGVCGSGIGDQYRSDVSESEEEPTDMHRISCVRMLGKW